ncbi:arylamine N-acetyltransferase family protein [Peribacillus kribbensis]|uniref:arylamine N-acetyltransferase family protein n=1 Tax=Peribacillus kribbensis TaxID=356658 RepID=UPI0003FA599A|nr:arylamine N-acetyltransferase [Peribacillus kribbensis]
MTILNESFRKRIGFPLRETLTFDKLKLVLKKTAQTIPFENTCIMSQMTAPITKESLTKKIIDQKEGGLCYELNAILYFFLMENEFHVSMIRGIIFDPRQETWSSTGKTHAAILLNHKGTKYLVDTGFGGNLPLVPIPLTGEVMKTPTGEFKAVKKETEYGDYQLKMKLKYKHTEFQTGYAFNSQETFTEMIPLTEIQEIILKNPESPFNKQYLITLLTPGGIDILTPAAFIRRQDGKETKEEINEAQFKYLAKLHFQLSNLQ